MVAPNVRFLGAVRGLAKVLKSNGFRGRKSFCPVTALG